MRITDFFGWIMIAGLFYALMVFACAVDQTCALFFMEPILEIER